MNDLIEARYYDNLLNDYLDSTVEEPAVETQCISELELNDLFECDDLIPYLSHNRISNDFNLEIEMEVSGEVTRIYE